MASERPRNPDKSEDEVFEEHLERINAGEPLARDEIRRLYPAFAARLIQELQLFEGLAGGREGRGDDHLGVLGDYTLRRQIGRGGMGVVYEAWENSMDRRVALKLLPAALAADDTALQRFVREARTAGRLHHGRRRGARRRSGRQRVRHRVVGDAQVRQRWYGALAPDRGWIQSGG